MTQIVANGEHTKIITNDLEVYVKGEYEIKITPSAGTLDVTSKRIFVDGTEIANVITKNHD